MHRDYIVNDMLSKLASDSKFVGLFMMIMGALICLSIIGLPFGIPYIFAGMRAKEGGNQLERYISSDDINDKIMAYENFGKHFNIIKILTIIGIVVAVLAIIFMFTVIMALITAFVGGGRVH